MEKTNTKQNRKETGNYLSNSLCRMIFICSVVHLIKDLDLEMSILKMMMHTMTWVDLDY